MDNISEKTILPLPYEICLPDLAESVRFCLDCVSGQGLPLDEIWVVGGPSIASDFTFPGFETVTIKHIQTDSKNWPNDIGSNQFLSTANSVYAALKDSGATTIISPLRGANTYFAMMANRAGLWDKDCQFITTCYLPKTLSLSGSLVLPSEIGDVIHSDMEARVLEFSDHIWVSHPDLIESITKTFRLPKSPHIKALKTPMVKINTESLDARHILFAGEPNPLYGFDAFCDLAEAIADELNTVTIILPKSIKLGRESSAQRKRLRKLPFTLNWILSDDVTQAFAAQEPGTLITPMRAPVFPNTAPKALETGRPVIWGSGFDITARQNASQALKHVPSDMRKIKHALKASWGETQDPSGLQAPILLPPVKNPAPKTRKKSRAPITKISVIVLHYDRLAYVTQALDSLAAQTLSGFELIIVDDGSTPDVFADLKTLLKTYEFVDARAVSIDNSYPSVARNHGAALASGDALFFVDDDNILDPGTLRAFSKALNNHDLALSFYQTFQDDNIPQFSAGNSSKVENFGNAFGFAGLLPGAALFYNVIGNSSMMIRKTVFLSLGGFSSKYGVGLEDYAFLAKAAMRSDIADVVLPEPYLHFRLHDKKIRNTHVDWRSATRLQAGLWRLLDDIGQDHAISPMAMGYARQLHEITSLQYVPQDRPRFFRLKFILVHQYIRRFLSKITWLRRLVVRFTSGESRLAKFLERLIF